MFRPGDTAHFTGIVRDESHRVPKAGMPVVREARALADSQISRGIMHASTMQKTRASQLATKTYGTERLWDTKNVFILPSRHRLTNVRKT